VTSFYQRLGPFIPRTKVKESFSRKINLIVVTQPSCSMVSAK